MGKRELYKVDNKRVPSVTTIIGRFKQAGGLMHWANEQGLNGLTLEEAQRPAATSGTYAHDMVEAHINGWDMPELRGDPEVVQNAESAFERYLEWAAQTKLEIEYTEVSLVSAKHKFGGKLDAIGKVNGKLCLVDWKTSNALYADYLYQVAAYKLLWEENYPEMPLEGGVHLCRFAKEHPDFTHSHYGAVDAEQEIFLMMRDLYDRVKVTEKRVK